ncbi:MAG: apolipoprotein N-acyltransferase [Pseudomonadota bacterium]
MKHFPHRASRWWDGIALFAGMLYPLGFAPVGFRLATLASLVVFWCSLQGLAAGRAARRGYLFGLGLFGVGVAWVYESLSYFGEAIAAVALLGTAGFIAVAALYPMLFAWLWARFFVGRVTASALCLALPSLWVLVEWFRGWFLGGFPWLVSGYASLDTTLEFTAQIGGVYFSSWVLLLLPAVISVSLCYGLSRKAAWLAVVCAAVLVVGASHLRHVDFTDAVGEPLSVRMVQGNIEQGVKFDPDNIVPSLERYIALSQQGDDNYDLLIWPETAVPAFYEQVDPVIGEFRDRLAMRGTDWLLGGFSFDWDTRRVFNAVRLVTDDSLSEYRKHHLVPFGEYLPFRSVLDALSSIIAVPMSDISSGPSHPSPLEFDGLKVAVSICYEDAFGEEVIRQLPAANLLVNVSNDAWFGDSWAPAQHHEIARMRTIETGRPQLRSTNTGISSLVDHRGRVIDVGPSFVEAVLDVSVQPRAGQTPYVRLGNHPVVLLLLTLVLVPAGLARRAALSYTAD